MEISDIKIIVEKLYEDIELNGIETIKKLFLKGTNLSEESRVNSLEEYIKKILISQMDIDSMLLSHKYIDTDLDLIPEYRKETEKLHKQIDSDSSLKFDENTINALFGNSLKITSIDDYEKWKEFTYSSMHNGIRYDTIYLEEEFKHNYENEKNIVKKFIKSFRYKKIMKGNVLEDVYVKRVREMLKKEISENPENTFIAHNNVHRLLEKGVAEYQCIKEIEDISRMTLNSFISPKTQEPINIEETCKSIRSEMKNQIGTTKIGKEYRQKAVTLGSETGISKRPVIQTILFEEIPRAMEELQKEYENIYKNEQSRKEYIKGVTKIYADFMFMQPYEDGNKRTALCLLNSMLISKNIIPPVVSLVNDEEMIKAFYKVQEKDYTMLQKLVIEKCTEMKKTSTDKRVTDTEEHIAGYTFEEREGIFTEEWNQVLKDDYGKEIGNRTITEVEKLGEKRTVKAVGGIENDDGKYSIKEVSEGLGEEYFVLKEIKGYNKRTGNNEQFNYSKDEMGNEFAYSMINGKINLRVSKTARGTTIERYDENGNILHSFEYDKDGKAIDGVQGMDEIKKDYVEKFFKRISRNVPEYYAEGKDREVTEKETKSVDTQKLGKETLDMQQNTAKIDEVEQQMNEQMQKQTQQNKKKNNHKVEKGDDDYVM